jgi:GNAT superfamily N-acetyltransferase
MRHDDAATVAHIHAVSWQSAYRGVLTDAFLDERAAANRIDHWRIRLDARDPAHVGLVAERGDGPVGFAYLIGAADPVRGTLLDNLHVLPDERGHGIGRRLLAAAAHKIRIRAWPAGLYLWVFEANVAARRFYARHGAAEVDREIYDAADGGRHPAVCCAWLDAASLLTG